MNNKVSSDFKAGAVWAAEQTPCNIYDCRHESDAYDRGVEEFQESIKARLKNFEIEPATKQYEVQVTVNGKPMFKKIILNLPEKQIEFIQSIKELAVFIEDKKTFDWICDMSNFKIREY